MTEDIKAPEEMKESAWCRMVERWKRNDYTKSIVGAMLLVLIVASPLTGDHSMTEGQFLTMLNTILSKHSCRISEANLDERVLFIEGDDDKLEACAVEIETILGDYLNG